MTMPAHLRDSRAFITVLAGGILLQGCGEKSQPVLPETSIITVSVTPKAATINAGAQASFGVTVTGSDNRRVVWRASGGLLSSTAAAATWTAPSASGVYTITAISEADSTKRESATVTVTPVVANSLAPLQP